AVELVIDGELRRRDALVGRRVAAVAVIVADIALERQQQPFLVDAEAAEGDGDLGFGVLDAELLVLEAGAVERRIAEEIAVLQALADARHRDGEIAAAAAGGPGTRRAGGGVEPFLG